MMLKAGNEFDFSIPQRQSAVGVVVESAAAFYRYLRALWPLLLLVLLKQPKFSIVLTILLLTVLVTAFFVYGYLVYRNLLFHIDANTKEFVLQEGVLNKKRTIISLDRIQQVTINQNFLQRLLNIYAIQISTAGSKDNELSISAVEYEVAQKLKQRLYNRNNEKVSTEFVCKDQPEGHMSINTATLLKVAITSDYNKTVAVILSAIATIYTSFIKGNKMPAEEFDFLSSFNFSSVLSHLGFFIFAVLLFVFFLNLIRLLIAYFNYRIRLHAGAISFSFGLFHTKSVVMYTDKVQSVRIISNYVQRKMGLVRVFFHQATSSEVEDKQSVVQLPGCTSGQKEKVLLQVFSALPAHEVSYYPNVRKIIFLSLKVVLIPATIIIVLVLVTVQTWLFYALAGWIPLAFVIIYFAFKNSKLMVNPHFIQIQSGAWDISTQIIEPYKIQAITTTQMLWHRKANVGHIKLHTAGGVISFKYGNFNKMNLLVNRWLATVETSRKKWM